MQSAKSELWEFRLQAHWAVQYAAALGAQYAEPKDDYSHTALTLENGVLYSAVTKDIRTGLRLHPFEVIVENKLGAKVFPLAGRSLSDLAGWLNENFEAKGLVLSDVPPPEVKSNVVAREKVFSAAAQDVSQELSRWFEVGDRLCEDFRSLHPNAGPVRIWPHHFDIAVSILLEPKLGWQKSPQILLGMTPGDAFIDEPYVYLSVWPKPASKWPTPEIGFWNQTEWTGWVVKRSDLTASTRSESDLSALAKKHGVWCLENIGTSPAER